MTNIQISTINRLDEAGLKKQISLTSSSKAENKDKIIAYCEYRLEHLNRSTAMVEHTEAKPGEFFQ